MVLEYLHQELHPVAPFAGAWIEMMPKKKLMLSQEEVAPFAGAWIEIEPIFDEAVTAAPSLPSRERGLKF